MQRVGLMNGHDQPEVPAAVEVEASGRRALDQMQQFNWYYWLFNDSLLEGK